MVMARGLFRIVGWVRPFPFAPPSAGKIVFEYRCYGFAGPGFTGSGAASLKPQRTGRSQLENS